MKQLAQRQRDFQQFLTHSQMMIEQSVTNCHPMSAKRRLKVYGDAYKLRLFEVLQIDYPKIEVLIGCDAFYNLCMNFIDQYPSKHFSVRYFGALFEAFLKQDDTTKEFGFLAEMANFEWSLMASLDAPDQTTFTLNELAQVVPTDWPELTFTFHPSVHHRLYYWDTPALWKDIENQQPPRTPIKLDSPQAWIFWRFDLTSRYESMSEFQVKLYTLMQEKLNFGDLAEAMAEFYPANEVPILLVQHLQYWIEQKIICLE